MRTSGLQSSLHTIFACLNNLVREIIEGGETFLVLSLWQMFCKILMYLQLEQNELTMLVSDLIAPLTKTPLIYSLFPLAMGVLIERTVFLYSSPVFQKVRKGKKKPNKQRQKPAPAPRSPTWERFVNETFQPVSFLLHLTLPDDRPTPGAPNRSIPGCPTIRCRAVENGIRNLPQKWTP